jgi:hypothetical protein
MTIFVTIGRSLADAFRTNWRFLTNDMNEVPDDGSSFRGELRELVERDLAVLVHRRGKLLSNDRWSDDLETFVSRRLRANLGGQFDGWTDGAVARLLDAIVADEEQRIAVRARKGRTLPVTSRFDSSWAS